MQFFSIRRLSPFQGYIQIIDDNITRAFTYNGHYWQIQIKHHLAKPKLENLESIFYAQKYVRYGIWSEQTGLSRIPLPPTLDAENINLLANRITDQIKSNQNQLPFKPKDCYEHWLLDRDNQQPAALLASAIEESRIDRSYVPEWLASSNDMISLTPDQANEIQFEKLESALKIKFGNPPYSQWFKRLADGSGVGLFGHRIDHQNQQRHLSVDKFPCTLLKLDWGNQELDRELATYTRWQAPYLLTLDNLPNDLRANLENFACDKPLAVYELHRLYPKIIQKKLIKRAIVEAQLRLTNIE